MAKATASCRCKICGKDFTVEKTCYNRKDADAYEAWASAHVDECPACRRARIAAEANEAAEEIIREYNIPEITGGTPKQIAYARDLRAKYLTSRKDLIASYAKQRRFEGSEKMIANLHAQATRKGGKAMLTEYRTHMMRYEYLPVLFCTGDAKTIINCLTGRY